VLAFLSPRPSAIAAACLCALATSAQATSLADTINAMAVNSWQKISLNTISSVFTPLAQRPTADSPSSNISAWSGAAFDSVRGNLMVWGGDIGNEQGNEVYQFNVLTGLWSRGSLPSQITSTNGVAHVVGGVNTAPLSGESWDNLVYLQGVDRLAVMGISRNGPTWLDPATGRPTGPYFWNPALADATKVSGATGSQVNPSAFPNVVGGDMWQNRGNSLAFNGTSNGRHNGGTTAYAQVGGKDVVYITDTFDNLWRYTVNDLNPANDTWVQIGRRPVTGQSGWGSAALDTTNNLYLKSLTATSFSFWDVDSQIGTSNRAVVVAPTITTGGALPDFRNLGIQYDATLDAFLMWDGSSAVWKLKAPSDLDANNDGKLDVGTGWTLERLNVAGTGPQIPAAYTGVYGKWQYMEGYNAYIGVIDPLAGDVFVYKATAAVPEPDTMLMLLAGLGGLGVLARRRQRPGL